jgi:hypothetical protein
MALDRRFVTVFVLTNLESSHCTTGKGTCFITVKFKWCTMLYLTEGYTNFGHQVTVANKFCMVTLDICGSPEQNLLQHYATWNSEVAPAFLANMSNSALSKLHLRIMHIFPFMLQQPRMYNQLALLLL